MGLLRDDDNPAILRGPMVSKYLQMLVGQVVWGELDYLILDLPPGTGDIQLTIVQTVAVDGAVIVTTPQEVALIDARKAVSMFAKVNVPILGIIENMAWFECEHGTRYPIFGEGGGKREAELMNVPLLAQIPIEIPIGAAGDGGTPIVGLADASSPAIDALTSAAQQIVAALTH
jgi:ATP-binding protein involved in chromosome partitioning